MTLGVSGLSGCGCETGFGFEFDSEISGFCGFFLWWPINLNAALTPWNVDQLHRGIAIKNRRIGTVNQGATGKKQLE
jgi:hypothetical protein